MKKHIKQVVSLLLVCTMVLTSSVTVFASEAVSNVKESPAAEQPTNSAADTVTNGNTADSTKTDSTQPSTNKENNIETKPGTDNTIETKPSVDKSENVKPETENKAETKPTTESNTTAKPSTENTAPSNATVDTTQKKEPTTDATTKQEGEVTTPITKEDKPFLALGANLTQEQQGIVLELLGINPAELSQYDVIYVTNEEEREYLGSYVSSDKIGTRSLSSVLVVKRDKGHGINITTKNISYCTIGMYKNALITAGITDADIIVAGPSPISGTAALVGALKAYSVMTGEKVSEASMDAALNELVLTGDIASAVGDNQKAEELLAYLKQQIIENGLDSEEEMRTAIQEACDKFKVSLTEDETNQLITLLLKIGKLDLDLDSIMNQAKSLYDKLSEMNSDGFFAKIGNFFQSILDFFQGLFGK